MKDEAEYDREIKRIYQNMLDDCQKEIESFYAKYAESEGITIADAKKRISKHDVKAFERRAARYVKEKNFSKKANEELKMYNATMRINRLEMLKANIGLELIAGHDELEKFMEGILQGRTEDELKRQAGILGKTVRNNAQKANAIVNASFHNATFSDRIWQYQDLLRSDVGKLLQSGLISGKNPRVLARELRKTFDTSVYNSERLMRTELARVQTEAQKQSFERNGFDMYEFITNSGCCDICQGLNGKHFKVAKMMPGENAPPMHPNCRCSVAAWEDSEEYEAWLDYLEKGGTTEAWNYFKRSTQTGGKRYVPYDPSDKKDIAAAKEYRKISRRNDIETIEKNSGFSKAEIKQIKRHIFFDKHKRYDEYGMLYPDYDMAVAWNRIYEGRAKERDILLLRHELLENHLEREYNLTIAEAHERAKRKYDWEAAIEAETGEDGEPYGLL